MEESADETRWVEAATSPPSEESPPWTRIRREAAWGEDEEAEEAGQAAAEKVAPLEGRRHRLSRRRVRHWRTQAVSCFPLARIPSRLGPAARSSRRPRGGAPRGESSLSGHVVSHVI